MQVFLRGHLWVEKHLRDLLAAYLADPAAINLDRMTFSQKVSLAQALGAVSEDEAVPLRTLNKIRNRMAHDLTGEPAEQEIASLESSLGGRHGKVLTALSNHVDPGNDITKRFEYVIIALLQHLEFETIQQRYRRKHKSALDIYYLLCAIDEDMGRDVDPEAHREKQGLPPFPVPSDVLLPPYGTGVPDPERGT